MKVEELQAMIKKQVEDICGPLVRDVVDSAMATQLDPIRSTQDSLVEKLAKRSVEPQAQAKVIPFEEKGMALARCVRASAAAKLRGAGPDAAMEILKRWGNDDLAESWKDAREKALAAGDATAGGFIVPVQYSTDIIEFLRARAVVRRLNARTVPVPTGTLKVPKLTGGATSYYVGENTNATKTEQTFGQLTLSFKKLITLVPISNDLIRYSSPGADALVRDDIVNAMRIREDSAFIRDDGTNSSPKGLRYWANTANILAANATVSVQNTFTDLGNMILSLLNADIPMISPGWIMAPRTETFLRTLLNSNGIPVFAGEMAGGRLMGFPFASTTSVPINVGTGSTRSEIYLVDFAQALIGESMNLIVDSSPEAAYHDGSSVVAAYSQDQTVVRAIAEHDFGMRHDKAIAVLTDVSWQPGSV